MRLLGYHLRIAWRSLGRDRAFTAAMVVTIGLTAQIWATALGHYLRLYGPDADAAPTIHHLEIERPANLDGVLRRSGLQGLVFSSRARLSFPELELVAGSGIPAREAKSVRAPLLVGPDEGSAVASELARFASQGFFPMFARRFRAGTPWPATCDDVAGPCAGQALPPVVLGVAIAERFFPNGDAVGRTISIEGRTFSVVGVLADHQPFRTLWDRTTTGGDEEKIYLPFAWFKALRSRPDLAAFDPGPGAGFEGLLASRATFVSYWVDLPDEPRKAAFTRHLEATLGAQGIGFALRDLKAFQREFAILPTQISFFTALSAIALLAGGFNLARLLLAKGTARAEELGIHRALGATRSTLFLRQMLEAFLVSLAGGLLALAFAEPSLAYFTYVVRDSDIPMHVRPTHALIVLVTTVLVGMLSAVPPAWRVARTRPTLYLGRR